MSEVPLYRASARARRAKGEEPREMGKGREGGRDGESKRVCESDGECVWARDE
jgi:hypothetical protein